MFSFVGYKFHLDSALVKPTQERWLKQDLILRLKSKHVLAARCLMSLIGLLASIEKMVPEVTPSHEAVSVSSQGALETSSVAGQPPSLHRNDFCTRRLVAEPHKRDERCRPSSQRPQHPTPYRRLKRRLGRSLRSKFYKGSVVRRRKKAIHSVLELKAVSLALQSFKDQCQNQTVLVATDNSTVVASGDVHSPVEDHDMMPSLSHHIESQTHSRVSKCDGRPSVQVELSSVIRMVTASAGVQTDLSKVVHTSCRSICHSSVPQTSTGCVSSPRPKCLGHRCSEHKQDGSHCLCLPSNASPSQGDPKNHIVIAPGLPGMPWFWDLVLLSTEIPLQLPVSTTLLKQSHSYVFHSNPHLYLHTWCPGMESSKNRYFLWRWQRELLPLRGQGPSRSQVGPI